MLERIRYSDDVTISYGNTNETHRDNGAEQGGVGVLAFKGDLAEAWAGCDDAFRRLTDHCFCRRAATG